MVEILTLQASNSLLSCLLLLLCERSYLVLTLELSRDPLQWVMLLVVRKLRKEERRQTIANAIVAALESVMLTIEQLSEFQTKRLRALVLRVCHE